MNESMRFVFFYHSVYSDWNNGNAHFLRGIIRVLMAWGHEVRVFEPRNGWSRENLAAEGRRDALADFSRLFPGIRPELYDQELDLDEALNGADVVLVHEWNAPELVAQIGRHRSRGGRYLLFFHDTHHRSVSQPEAMAAYELDGYDGVLAFGEVVREIYDRMGWARRAWTWHEAADTHLFRPQLQDGFQYDLVWIGNWGDEERSTELQEFLLAPIRELQLTAGIFGVRYPEEALRSLKGAGAEYGGWLPNHLVPQVFGRAALTVHVPRRPYVRRLPGIPTIRVFEALACGIPLICTPWQDSENLFRLGHDYLMVDNREAMKKAIRLLLSDREQAVAMARHGLETINNRHTCAHRVDELLSICGELSVGEGRQPQEPFAFMETKP